MSYYEARRGRDDRGGSGRGGRGGFRGDGGYREGGGRGDGGYRGRGGDGGYRGRGGDGGFRGRGGDGGFRGRGGGAPRVPDRIGPVDMLTNHFKLAIKADAPTLYHHMVNIAWQSESAQAARLIAEIRREVMDAFLKQEGIDPLTTAYDGDHILIMQQRLAKNVELTLRRTVYALELVPQGGGFTLAECAESGKPLNPTLNQALEVVMASATLDRTEFRSKQTFLSLKDNCMLDLAQMAGRQAADIAPKQLWMGHFQTVAFTDKNAFSTDAPERQLTVTVNAASSLAYDSQSLDEFVRIRTGKSLSTIRSSHVDSRLENDFKRLFQGLKFQLNHFESGPRSCKLATVSRESARSYQFDFEGESITVEDYYLRKYGIKLKNPHAPLLVKSPASRNTVIPLECISLKRQRLTGPVSDLIRRHVVEIMTMEPGKRLDYVQNAVRENFGDNAKLDSFGIGVDKQALVVKGLTIAPPTLSYAVPRSPNSSQSMMVSRGSWNLMNCAFNDARPIKHWALYTVGSCSKDQVQDCIRRIKQMASSKLNMKWDEPPKFFDKLNGETAIEERANFFRKSKQEGRQLDLLIFIIRDRSSSLYQTIKSAFDDVCPTQVLTETKTPILNNKDRGVDGHFANILSKINQKTGGVNQLLDNPSLELPALQRLAGNLDTAIIAVDISHPSAAACPNATRRRQLPSLSAIVCSVDLNCTKYVHAIRGQIEDIETCQCFTEMLQSVLETRSKLIQREWPKRVIFLRDGSSDGSFEHLLKTEVAGIEGLYRSVNKPAPEVLAIAVRKRHQTRFFPKDQQDGRVNMPAGTMVIDNLTLPVEYPNFYLLSHAGIKGTSHPTRYIIVRDDFKDKDPRTSAMNKQDLLMFYSHFVYQLCHLYGRCQRSVSIPAPVYYAHLAADRGRLYIHQIATRTYGHGLLSDSESVSSGGNSLTRDSPVDAQSLKLFNTEMNKRLSDFDAMASPMSYV